MHRIHALLKQKASETNTALWIIEKDYALSYLLMAISDIPLLHDLLVLKGGTALRKTYFQNYRFSEDLDFSTNAELDELEIRKSIAKAIQNMEINLRERGPFNIQSESLILREPHPGQQIAYAIRVQFPYHREAMCRIKVEITVDEPVLLVPESRKVLHDFDEPLEAKVNVYQLSEIIAEKFRALLQSLYRLQKKGWGANRICRDYYDLWWILKELITPYDDIPSLTNQKCGVRDVDYQQMDNFFDPLLIEVARKEWDKLLVPFIPENVAVETVLTELQTFTRDLWNKAL